MDERCVCVHVCFVGVCVCVHVCFVGVCVCVHVCSMGVHVCVCLHIHACYLHMQSAVLQLHWTKLCLAIA